MTEDEIYNTQADTAYLESIPRRFNQMNDNNNEKSDTPKRMIMCIYCEEKKDPELHPFLFTCNQKCNECHKILGDGIG